MSCRTLLSVHINIYIYENDDFRREMLSLIGWTICVLQINIADKLRGYSFQLEHFEKTVYQNYNSSIHKIVPQARLKRPVGLPQQAR